MKKRIYSLDVIRAFATFLIFTFHFNMGTNDNIRQIYNTSYFFRNIDLGSLGVSIFFILSGCSLLYNDHENFSITKYYKKRFLSIFPLFYMAYLLCRFIHGVFVPHSYANIPLKYLILTLLGMDGFLSYKYPTFYITGEWFLGCIIILYLIYPLLRMLIKKIPIISFIGFLIIHILVNAFYCFEIPQIWNPLVRISEFVFGMYFAQFVLPVFDSYKNNHKNNVLYFILIILTGVFAFILLTCNYDSLMLPHMTVVLLCGACVFMFLFLLGDLLTFKPLRFLNEHLSKYSFAIFLVHHPIEQLLASHFAYMEMSYMHLISIYLMYVLIIGLLGVFLQKTTNWIMGYMHQRHF